MTLYYGGGYGSDFGLWTLIDLESREEKKGTGRRCRLVDTGDLWRRKSVGKGVKTKRKGLMEGLTNGMKTRHGEIRWRK